MEQKLSDTLVKAIDRSNPMMQNLQLASRFNKLVEEGGGGADLEDNKEATIDVSAYTEPVEVTPTQGKDGMKKVTVSLSNIPAGVSILYGFKNSSGDSKLGYCLSSNPSVGDTVYFTSPFSSYGSSFGARLNNDAEVQEVGVDEETGLPSITVSSYGYTLIRNSDYDFEIWNVPPEVETTKQATIDVSTYDPANKPVITPTTGKQSMAEVEVTLDNIPQIEANKAQTIDVSQYTDPVEITPTSGKDGMAKVTVTLSNIPSGGVKAYAINYSSIPTDAECETTLYVAVIGDNADSVGFGIRNHSNGASRHEATWTNNKEYIHLDDGTDYYYKEITLS